MENVLNFRADKSKIAWIIFGALVPRLFLFLTAGTIGFGILTKFNYSLAKIFAIIVFVICTLYMLSKINGLRKAHVYIYDNRIFIQTPIGERYDLDVVENDLRQKWISVGWRFWQRRRTYQYGLSFQMDGREMEVPLDWLKDEHRQRIFSRIAYLNNESNEDVEFDFPMEFEVLKERVADNICSSIVFNLILYGIFGGFVSLFVRFGLQNFPTIIRDSTSFVAFAYFIFKPFKDVLSFRRIQSQIPSRVEINERGICFGDEEILYEDMLSVSIYGWEKESFYSFRILTETKDYQYPLGIDRKFFLEPVGNENYQSGNLNENISFLMILKKMVLKNGVDYFVM